MDRIKKSWRTLLVCLLLAAAPMAVFWPVFHHDIVNLDDPQYISDNEHVTSGLSWENIEWAFTSGYASNWHPLTWVSHMLDVQLFGLKPGPHHLVSLAFHIVNGLLLFLVLKRMSGALWRSACVAALFALHPLHVESVAWISERKDVLSALFFFLTLWAYVRYAEKAGGSGQSPGVRGPQSTVHSRTFYILSLLFFALGLLSKPMLVTVPFVLLLLDYWPLGRFQIEIQKSRIKNLLPLLVEKVPFFLLAIASSTITLLVQSPAMVNPAALSLGARLAHAGLSYIAYMRQTFWPADLAVFYPYLIHPSDAEVFGAAAALLVATAVAVLLGRRRLYAPVGWFWFLGMLVPVIGIVQVGAQGRADRYTYLPLIGIFVLVVWGARDVVAQVSYLLSRKSAGPSTAPAAGRPAAGLKPAIQSSEAFGPDGSGSCLPPLSRWLLASAAAAILAALAVSAHRQVGFWKNSETVFTHAVEVTQDNYMALMGLGFEELHRGNAARATTYFNRAASNAAAHGAEKSVKYYIGTALQMQGKGLEALPYLEAALPPPGLEAMRDYRLGLSLIEAGRLAEAETALKGALAARPGNPDFQLGMGVLAFHQGQPERAEQIFREVVARHPGTAQGQRTYGDFLLELGRPAEAEIHYAAALNLHSEDVVLRRSYAKALSRVGKPNEALTQLEAGLKLEPANVEAACELADLLSQQGRSREAIARYNQALGAEPKFVSALNNLAWLLATDPDGQVRNGARAVELAERACQLTEWKEAFLMGTLAAAYAEAGRFNDAVAMAEKARDRARAQQQEAVAKRNEVLLTLYRAGKAYHEGGPG